MRKRIQKIMTISKKGIEIIKKFEGLARVRKDGMIQAYPDPASGNEPYTIGYGTTIYPEGVKVKKGDVITREEAEEYLLVNVKKNYCTAVISCIGKAKVTQNQFDALVSFVYNVGGGAFKKSTMLKKILINPNDPTIRSEFAKWNKAAGKVFAGLTKRRKEEADLYFS